LQPRLSQFVLNSNDDNIVQYFRNVLGEPECDKRRPIERIYVSATRRFLNGTGRLPALAPTEPSINRHCQPIRSLLT